jgi:predicted nucleic acid-binding Zn ribbon protein
MAGWPGGRRVVLDECQILYRWRKAMKRKKVQMIIAGVVLVAVIAGGVFFTVFREGDSSGGNPDSAVYVDSVAELCGLGSGNGLTDRFAGVVEPQKTWEIELPSDKKVDEILVQEGDKGTKSRREINFLHIIRKKWKKIWRRQRLIWIVWQTRLTRRRSRLFL